MALCKKTILILLMATMTAILAAGCSSSQTTSGTNSGNAGVKTAPDFTAQTLNGDTVSFSSFKGKPVVLNFAASWCGPCEMEAPVLAKAYAKYKDKVQFFGLAIRDSEEDQRAFAQKHGLEFPIGLDPDGKIVYQFQKAGKVSVSGIPTTFFIDKDGIIVDYFIGPLSEKTLDQKIQSILPS